MRHQHSSKPSPIAGLFDRIYVLNLPERRDRRREMLAELRLAGFPAPAEKVRFFSAIRPIDAGPFPSVGSRGCFMSHLDMLREARRDKLLNVLILEDDLAFWPHLRRDDEAVAEDMRRIPWDLAYLGHPLRTDGAGDRFRSLPSNEGVMTTFCYAARQRVIPPLIEFLEKLLTRPAGGAEPGPMHIDGAISTFRASHPEFTTLIAQPSLGHQRPSRSDIAPPRWYYRVPILGIAAAAARRARARSRRRLI